MTPVLLALSLLAGPRIDIAVGAGAASNPFELPDDQVAAQAESSPRPGAFFDVDGSLLWKTPPRRLVRAGIEGDLVGTFYTFVAQDPAAPNRTRARDADRWTGEISAPLVIDPARGRSDRWGPDLRIEPFAGAHRETYTSHRTGTPLRVDDNDDPDIDLYVDLADRYDTNEYGVRADSELSLGRLADVVVGGGYTLVDYVEDYDQTATVDSWDHVEARGEIDAYLRPGDWLFAAGYTLRNRTYDERFPRDAAGDKVLPGDPGYEPQVFTYHDISFRGGLVRDRGRAVVRFRNTRRVDEFAGYQSYSENALYGDFRLELTPGSELRFEPSYAVRTYDELRVNYDPQEPVSDRRSVGMETRYEWPAFSSTTNLFVSAGLVSQASANPLYSFLEFHATTGVRVQWR